MNKLQLEKHLANSEEWGLKKDTKNSDILGWILLSKRMFGSINPNNPQTEPELYQWWEEDFESVRKYPYQVIVMEVHRELLEREEDFTRGECHYWENHYVSNLDEVEELLQRFGYSIDDLRNRRELNAP